MNAPAGILLSDCVLIAGQRGKGKSTLARYIADRLQPVRTIHFDPKGEMQFPGVAPARSPEALAEALRGPVVHYIPSGFERPELERACELVWRCPGPWVWDVDELAEVSNPGYAPAGLRRAATQGRVPRKMLLGNTQRLAEVHPCFRSQAEHVFIFTPAPPELDLKMIGGSIGREAGELRAELEQLHAEHGDYSHLWFVRSSNELRPCAPLPAPAPARRAAPAPPEGRSGGAATTQPANV